ncbi:MAG: lipoate--protein ligase family protein [Candidatus Nanopelagicales bacterium]
MTALLEGAPAHVEDRTAAAVARLREVAASDSWGVLEWGRPGRSAAFSRRDERSAGFADAVESVRLRGFEPFVRPVGGRLACYHDGSLVLDLLVRNADPRPGTTARFRVLADTIAVGLGRLGVDARTGAVPDEYCPGEWSVNAGGRTKLVGTGQRLVRGAVLLTAVIVVGDPEPLAEAMGDAYKRLGLAFDPRSVGSVSQSVPGVTLADVEDAVGGALAERLRLSAPDLVSGRELPTPWDPR